MAIIVAIRFTAPRNTEDESESLLASPAIVKMRGGNHSKDIREYEITSEGLVIGPRVAGYRGLITGIPEWTGQSILESETPLE